MLTNNTKNAKRFDTGQISAYKKKARIIIFKYKNYKKFLVLPAMSATKS